MASLTIRRLDEKTKTRLRVRAAHNGRSMEEEARAILRAAVLPGDAESENLGQAIRRRFSALGGIELKLPKREPMREPPDFGA